MLLGEWEPPRISSTPLGQSCHGRGANPPNGLDHCFFVPAQAAVRQLDASPIPLPSLGPCALNLTLKASCVVCTL
jgi:hypothetical protein